MQALFFFLSCKLLLLKRKRNSCYWCISRLTTFSQIYRLWMVTSVLHRTAVNSNKNLYIYNISICFYNCHNRTAVKPLVPYRSIRCYLSEYIIMPFKSGLCGSSSLTQNPIFWGAYITSTVNYLRPISTSWTNFAVH